MAESAKEILIPWFKGTIDERKEASEDSLLGWFFQELRDLCETRAAGSGNKLARLPRPQKPTDRRTKRRNVSQEKGGLNTFLGEAKI